MKSSVREGLLNSQSGCGGIIPFHLVGFSWRALRKMSEAVVAAIDLVSVNNLSFSSVK